MKKLNQKGFSGIEIALTILVVGLIGGSGYLVYQRQQDKKQQETLQNQVDDLKKQGEESKNIAKKQTETSSQTEDEKILAAANCQGADVCKINEKKEGLAWVVTGSNEGDGGNIFLAQAAPNEEWTIIYEGNGYVPEGTINKYNIPESWLGPNCSDCTQ